ncbi:hypothetical protein HYFRA_00009066 [Hymenoscyphus fraxineus]|uniref:Major facilitator superfamily (MFS) profile domain-containing protein n=1 Tax=Hymenoscyphus fraxineus TaxID=746836 RepID=A0A9N9KYT3_9HELO|nr:hypothetical protein HYFRA_00009066 [Hymenoscyphus fraxineus]
MVDLEKAEPAENNNDPVNSNLTIATSEGGEQNKPEDASLRSKSTLNHTDDDSRPRERNERDLTPTQSQALSVISRSKRRGLFGRFTIVPEVENPYEYKRSTKWGITLVIALAAAAAPLGSAIFLPALPQLSKDLNTTPTITNLSVALYMLSLGIFPLWWSSFSETLGRRTIYIVSFALFTIFNIVAALSTSIAMLIVLRILGGGAAASVQAVGAGTIADIWEVKERGRAMGIFYLGPLLGPLLAPIFGGALSQRWGWRSTQWFQAIYGFAIWIVIVFLLPETLRRQAAPTEAATETLTRTSTTQSKYLKTKRFVSAFKRCIIDPLSVLAYLRFPAVFFSVFVASIAFGSLYVLNISIQQTFSESPYNYTVIILGLLYIPNSLGYICASLLGGPWTDHIMKREAIKANRYDENGKLKFLPEDRMRENIWLAAFLFPGAMLWYGWTAQKGLHFIIPCIANFFFGVGSMLVFSTITTMLTEFMPKRSSSLIAVNNFIRNIFSCVGGVVTQPIISAIGNGWLFTILSIVSWISAFGVVWAMMRFGPRWRVEMNKKLNS